MKGWTFLRSAAVRYPWAEQQELLEGGAEEPGKEKAGVKASPAAAEGGEKFATLLFFFFSYSAWKPGFCDGQDKIVQIIISVFGFQIQNTPEYVIRPLEWKTHDENPCF